MNRDYGNSIEPYQTTGFPSACAEFAEKGLSLDEFFDFFNPGKLKYFLHGHFNHGFGYGDLVQIEIRKPKSGEFVLLSDGGHSQVFKCLYRNGSPYFQPGGWESIDLNDATVGVITALHRDMVVKD